MPAFASKLNVLEVFYCDGQVFYCDGQGMFRCYPVCRQVCFFNQVFNGISLIIIMRIVCSSAVCRSGRRAGGLVGYLGSLFWFQSIGAAVV